MENKPQLDHYHAIQLAKKKQKDPCNAISAIIEDSNLVSD